MSDDIDYIHQKKNVVYIFSLGAGSEKKDKSSYDYQNNVINEIIDYKTEKKFLGMPMRDFLNVRDDIKKIRAEKPITEKYRLKKLFELLLLYLLNTSLNIVLIGFSHGCVIIHGAILKLKMKMKIQKSSYIDRITIMAVNSPNLIPPKIIDTDKTNKVFNIYNIKDNILSLGKFFRITKSDYLPDLSYSHIKTLKFSEGITNYIEAGDISFEYSFDKNKRIIYINIDNIIKLYTSSHLIKQLYRHSLNVNLIVLFKSINNRFHIYPFLNDFNGGDNHFFMEFDRDFYLYTLNQLSKEKLIEKIIKSVNDIDDIHELLKSMNKKEICHLYSSILYTSYNTSDIPFLADAFIRNNLNFLTFQELYDLYFNITNDEILDISNLSSLLLNDLLNDLLNYLKKYDKTFNFTLLDTHLKTLFNVLNKRLDYILRQLLDNGRIIFTKNSLSLVDEEILFSIYIKVKNHDLNGQIYQRQNSA